MPVSNKFKEIIDESSEEFKRAHKRAEKSKTIVDAANRRSEMREAIRDGREAINKQAKAYGFSGRRSQIKIARQSSEECPGHTLH